MYTTKLAKLRNAIFENDWIECEDIFHSLMAEMGIEKAKTLALKTLKDYLPIFEATHPQVDWHRTLLDLLENQEFIESSKSFPGLGIPFPDSSSNGFLSVLALLDEATHPDTTQVLRTDLLSDVVVGTINLRRRKYWAGKFPEDAKIAERSALGETEIPFIQSKYLKEPDVQLYTQSLWSEIITEVNRLLNLD